MKGNVLNKITSISEVNWTNLPEQRNQYLSTLVTGRLRNGNSRPP